MLKYIIVVIGSKDTGKTSSLTQFWDFLPCANNDKTILHPFRRSGDLIGLDTSFPVSRNPHQFCKVGLNTKGDKKEHVFEGLYTLCNAQSDIIVTACHSEKMFLAALDLFSTYTPAFPINGIDRSKLKAFLSELTSPDVEIIFTSHYQKYIPINRRTKSINPANSIVGGVDLNRLFAQHLVDLIERLKK